MGRRFRRLRPERLGWRVFVVWGRLGFFCRRVGPMGRVCRWQMLVVAAAVGCRRVVVEVQSRRRRVLLLLLIWQLCCFCPGGGGGAWGVGFWRVRVVVGGGFWVIGFWGRVRGL